MATKGIFLVLTEPESENVDLSKMNPDELGQHERIRMTKRKAGRIQAAMEAGVRVAFGSDRYYHEPTWSRGMAACSGLMSYKRAACRRWK